jgi:dihydroorotase-like cyclic amidohydrolase
MTSRNPAAIWGLGPDKGSIRVGAHADLTIINPDAEWTVTGTDLLHAQRWTQYEGRVLRGRIVRTLVRGTTVYDAAAASPIRVEPGYGRFIPHQRAG